MSSLKGPKHGGANIKAKQMLDVIRENVKLEEQEISMADFEKLFQK